MDAQFEHLCRICAANTKCKKNSVVESVFIFKTTGLKDKISRHLFLNVAEDDALPKVLCKSCYRQVEATASLSNIAKHTQRVFQDFLLSTVPKHTRQATATHVNESPVPSIPTQDTTDSNQISNNMRHQHSNLGNESFHPILLTRPSVTSFAPNLPQQVGKQVHDDILISLTNKERDLRQQDKQQLEPITENSNNLSSVKMNNLMLPTRRNSVFVDTRYSSAPMSIAQRSMQLPPSLTPIHSEVALSKVVQNSPEKRHSPAGVINFIQTHGRITGCAPTITTGVNKGHNTGSASSIHITKPPESSTCASQNVSNSGYSNLPNSVIQQKRRNLKNALSNISAIRDGQVSLLKSAHQRQIVEDIDIRPLVTTTVVPHKSLYGVEPSVEEVLPEHIIIAAPKKKKEEPGTLLLTVPPKLHKNAATALVKSVRSEYDVSPMAESLSSAKSKTIPSMNSLTDAISLGNVIRDPDLLMLILKALKWPVTTGNCEEQMAKLKNSKFAVIMSDTNLLQDNDLTQLLGPYLGPMMAIVQQQPKHPSINNISTPSPPASPSKTSVEQQTIEECTMPYKLPPETSVQLVPTSPTDKEHSQQLTNNLLDSISKRPQRKSRLRELGLNGQHSTADVATTSKAALVTNELLNNMLISQYGSNQADALNEALTSMLKQQQNSKTPHIIHRRRSASATNTPLDLEDIILVEPQPLLEDAAVSENNINAFMMPPQELPEPPSITRPIIKRRKVVPASRQNCSKTTSREDISMYNTDKDILKSEPKKCEVIENVGCTNSKVMENCTDQQAVEAPQAPTSTVSEVVPSSSRNLELADCDAIENKAAKSISNIPNISSVRKTNVKSALGQKLLEAIGLPQLGKNVPTENSRDTLRSALKRSLKQAQEQQLHLKRVKQEEPVKQLADSTTKPVAGESSEEHKKAIAERELELLTRKTKSAEKHSLSIKDEKSERTDVSSSSSRNRRGHKKSKTDAHEDDTSVEERKSERWDEDDDLPLKTEHEKNAEHINRPTRTSKTMSKYYKCPLSDKDSSSQKSQHAMGRRSTRQR